MTYRAKIENGQVVFEGGIKPAEGSDLIIDVVEQKQEETVGQRMLKLAGIIKGDDLPEDGAQQLDHYLYGTPKK